MFLFDEKNQICYPNLSLYKVWAARDLYRCLPVSRVLVGLSWLTWTKWTAGVYWSRSRHQGMLVTSSLWLWSNHESSRVVKAGTSTTNGDALILLCWKSPRNWQRHMTGWTRMAKKLRRRSNLGICGSLTIQEGQWRSLEESFWPEIPSRFPINWNGSNLDQWPPSF